MPLPCERKTITGWIVAAKTNLEACTAIELAGVGFYGDADPAVQVQDLMDNITTAAYKLEKVLQLIALKEASK